MHSGDNVTCLVVCFGADPPRRRVYGGSRLGRSISQGRLGALAAALEQTAAPQQPARRQQPQQPEPLVAPAQPLVPL